MSIIVCSCGFTRNFHPAVGNNLCTAKVLLMLYY
ncbi:hypothetical protein Anas_05521 [Armadillidium nasatum]|uniref:Uncharacterized protein n=1 Tax=Armadillidium nasatum TaxID=96803 RepID=A0A5N5TGZ7_9CRUS|nr:hypothetical protein Anas_06242 [Armadillidium nasatum]KAB7504190.1 hypothetical protein Anas_05521 [Armadillidium nasatum]